ncbi:MAG: Type I restriction-modification system, restriction subunit R [Limosilactobacillus fermentum]|jgi:type I restriction enzyme, R subunit
MDSQGHHFLKKTMSKGRLQLSRGKSHLIDTTEKLFGPELHRYTIDEAIRDGNVLGFNVDYINTGEFKNYEDLRDQLIQIKLKQNEEANARAIERDVRSMDKAQVESEALKNKLLVYHDETHIPQVVKTILENWDYQSQNKEFNAILTVARKDRAVAYFDEFQKQLVENKQDLNIAVTFSFGNENDPDNIANPELVERMFSSYEKFTGIKFAFGDKKSGSDAYFEDLVDRATRGGSGLNPTNIDLVIVADQLLTGYDSKKLNTLYVDRSLELQGLIQAYSRTNRVFKKNKKDFGIIVNFQYPALTKKRVNTALELYGSGGKSSLAIVERYGDAVAKFANLVSKMQDTLKDPANWMDLKSDEDALKKFMDAFLAAAKQLSHVQQYYEYKWSDKKFTISEHQWMRYRGAYQNLRGTNIVDPPFEEPVELISTQSKLVDTQQVTADSILKLIGNKKRQAHNNQLTEEDLQNIEDWIQDLSDQGEYQKAQLIKQFLDEVVLTDQEEAIEDINDEFDKWKQRQLAREVEKFARKWGIDEDLLQKSVQNYNSADPEVIPYIADLNKAISFDDAEDKSCGKLLKHKMTVMKELPKWIASTTNQYK